MYPGSGIAQYKKVDIESSIFDISPYELIKKLFKSANDNLLLTEEAINNGRLDKRSTYINKVVAILDCLRGSLDHTHAPDMTKNLDALYDYMTWALIEANQSNSRSQVIEVREMLAELASAWDQIDPSEEISTNHH